MSGWVAGAVVVAGVGGALVSANAAKQAAKSQGHAADLANETQRSQWEQQRADQMPWLTAGSWALGQLQRGMLQGGQFGQHYKDFKFEADPGYQFRLQQGEQALGRSAAARGGALGGGTLKALTRYNSGQAAQEYAAAFDRYGQDWNRFNTTQTNDFNRLASMAGMGQTSVNTLGAAGQNYANNIAQNQIGVGNANAAAGLYAGNQYGQALNQIGNAWYQRGQR